MEVSTKSFKLFQGYFAYIPNKCIQTHSLDFLLLVAGDKSAFSLYKSQHPRFNVKVKELIFTNTQTVARLQMAGLRSDSRGGAVTEAGGARRCCPAGST